MYRGGNVVVGDVSPFSVLGEVPTGSVITKYNGNILDGYTADGIKSYFARHPASIGDVIEYRTPDGTISTLALGATLGAVQDVRLVNVDSINLTAADFNAQLVLLLRRQAEYRLSDQQGNSLSDWNMYGPDATVTIVSAKIARTADDEYEIYVDRKIDEIIKRFQITFKLEAE
jgi:hypothetical protein